MMTGLSSGAATGGGGSCSFEKDGLVPVVTAATAIASAFTTAPTTSATVVASILFDCFHFTYFNAQIGQPIVITSGATTPANVSYYTANRHQLPPVIPGTTKFPFKNKSGNKTNKTKLQTHDELLVELSP
jgi:hypothetical protein